jgi:hypothetical protein
MPPECIFHPLAQYQLVLANYIVKHLTFLLNHLDRMRNLLPPKRSRTRSFRLGSHTLPVGVQLAKDGKSSGTEWPETKLPASELLDTVSLEAW